MTFLVSSVYKERITVSSVYKERITVSSVYKERITVEIKSNVKEIVMVYIIILILHVCMCTFYYTVCIHSYLP